MERIVWLVLALVCGIGGAALYASMSAPVERGGGEDGATDARLARIEAALENLATRLEGLPVRVEAPVAGAAFPSAEPMLAGTGEAAVESEEARRERLRAHAAERIPDYKRRSTDVLWLEASSKRKSGDTAGAVLRWRSICARELKPEKRIEALGHLGVDCMKLGMGKEAEAAYREQLETLPAGDPREAGARSQIGLSLWYQKDYRGALAEQDRVVRMSGASSFVVANARHRRVLCFQDMGDAGAAESELRAMIRDYGGDEKLDFFAERAKGLLGTNDD